MELKNNEQKTCYALGLNFAMQLANMPMELDREAFIAGLNDMLDGKKPQITQEEFTKLLNELFDKIDKANHHHCGGDCDCDDHCGCGGCHDSAETKKAGQEYREANAKKAGVSVTASGLQVEHVKEGSGKSPKSTDTVKVHYTGKLIDGTVFDSSVQRGTPLEFPLNRVIPGWTEGLQLMKVGGKAILTIPPELGYGEHGAGDVIPPHATLVFEVELLDIK